MIGYLAAIIAMTANVVCQVVLSGVFRRTAEVHETGRLRPLARALLGDPLFWIGCGAAFLMLASWALALSQLPLARILPVMALLFLFSPLLAWLVYGERLSAINLAGFVVLTTGVILSAWK